jgi:hypothetical protein
MQRSVLVVLVVAAVIAGVALADTSKPVATPSAETLEVCPNKVFLCKCVNNTHCWCAWSQKFYDAIKRGDFEAVEKIIIAKEVWCGCTALHSTRVLM